MLPVALSTSALIVTSLAAASRTSPSPPAETPWPSAPPSIVNEPATETSLIGPTVSVLKSSSDEVVRSSLASLVVLLKFTRTTDSMSTVTSDIEVTVKPSASET